MNKLKGLKNKGEIWNVRTSILKKVYDRGMFVLEVVTDLVVSQQQWRTLVE